MIMIVVGIITIIVVVVVVALVKAIMLLFNLSAVVDLNDLSVE